jgi:ribosomal protein L15E
MDSRHTTGALRVERPQQVERFRAAHFTDDDAIVTAPQRGTEEAAIRDKRQRGEPPKGARPCHPSRVHIVRLFKQNL